MRSSCLKGGIFQGRTVWNSLTLWKHRCISFFSYACVLYLVLISADGYMCLSNNTPKFFWSSYWGNLGCLCWKQVRPQLF